MLLSDGIFFHGLKVVSRLSTALAAPMKPGMHFSRHGSHFRQVMGMSLMPVLVICAHARVLPCRNMQLCRVQVGTKKLWWDVVVAEAPDEELIAGEV